MIVPVSYVLKMPLELYFHSTPLNWFPAIHSDTTITEVDVKRTHSTKLNRLHDSLDDVHPVLPRMEVAKVDEAFDEPLLEFLHVF